MKNKGFTLIEMIGIITVLAVILLVVFPNISNGLKTMKEAKEKNFTDNLKISAEAYIGIYQDNYPELKTPNGSIQIKIKDLYDSNLLKGRYENIDFEDTVSVIVGTDGLIRYFFDDEQIGIDEKITSDISKEAELIREKLQITTPDGIYYYNNQGNLVDSSNQITLTRTWDNPTGNILVHNHQFISGCININNKNYDYYKGQITELNYPCSTTRGENLVINGDLSYKNDTNFYNFTYTPDEGTNGYLSVTSSTLKSTSTNYYVPVDAYNKSYNMGMTARTNQTTATYYIGFRSYDIDMQEISPAHFEYIPNTLTTLARDLNNGDEYIYITDLTNWNKTTTATYQRAFIFWNYKDSTGYTYPELTYSRNISPSDAYSNENIDVENNRIKLNTRWDRGHVKAGTKLSQRSSGATFVFNIKAVATLSTNWQDIAATQIGVQNTGVDYPYTKFWPGTKYIKLFWWNNYNSVENTTTNYKNIYIREVTE